MDTVVDVLYQDIGDQDILYKIDEQLMELGIPLTMDAEELKSLMLFYRSLYSPICPLCEVPKIDENEDCQVAHWSYDVILQAFGVFRNSR